VAEWQTTTAGRITAHEDAPLVLLGQGDYQTAYPRERDDRTRGHVLRRNVATLQARAGAVCGRAGYLGHALQNHGPATAARELQELGKIVDTLLAAMHTVAEQLDAEVNR
jgi:hypothetical protein